MLKLGIEWLVIPMMIRNWVFVVPQTPFFYLWKKCVRPFWLNMHLKLSQSQAPLLNVRPRATCFWWRWHFYNTVGALDSKHRRPVGGGSMFYNYKKYHSIVLQALADANYLLIWVDMDASLDSQIWNSCNLKGAILENTAGFLGSTTLPGDD